MTRPQYKEAIKKLGLSPVEAGRLLGFGRRQSNRLVSDADRTPIPHLAGIVLKLLLNEKIAKEDLL